MLIVFENLLLLLDLQLSTRSELKKIMALSALVGLVLWMFLLLKDPSGTALIMLSLSLSLSLYIYIYVMASDFIHIHQSELAFRCLCT